MARQMSATRRDGLATFLLEMALDKARMKARLASVLIEERTKRGHGDARRFPQPEMADLLDYSLRQYQRLEDPDSESLPNWDTLTRILDLLGRPSSDIFGDDEEAEIEGPEARSDGDGSSSDLEEAIADLGEKVDRILELLEPRDSPADRDSAREPSA
jgi:transcriptional regulator with XRE-family HTH domain